MGTSSAQAKAFVSRPFSDTPTRPLGISGVRIRAHLSVRSRVCSGITGMRPGPVNRSGHPFIVISTAQRVWAGVRGMGRGWRLGKHGAVLCLQLTLPWPTWNPGPFCDPRWSPSHHPTFPTVAQYVPAPCKTLLQKLEGDPAQPISDGEIKPEGEDCPS